jgi:hypothetical protein
MTIYLLEELQAQEDLKLIEKRRIQESKNLESKMASMIHEE